MTDAVVMPARTLPQPRSSGPQVDRGPGAGAAPAPPGGPGLSLRGIATYSSTLFGLLCLIKVYGVARYSTTTTATLVTTAPEQVILGTLAIYVYPTMAALAYGIPWLCLLGGRRVRPQAWPVLLAAALIAPLMTPLEYHLAGLVLVAVSLLVELLLRHRATAWLRARLRIPASVPVAARGHSLAVLGGLALLVGFLDTLESPWMSAELFVSKGSVVTTTQQPDGPQSTSRHVAIVSSADPVVGYLIDENSTDFTILNADTRYVMHVAKTLVVDRYTCHETDTQLRGRVPLLDRLLGRRYASANSDCAALREYLLRDQAPPSVAGPGEPVVSGRAAG